LANRTLAYQAQKTSGRKKKHEKTTKIYMHDDLVDYFEKIVPASDNPNAPLFPSLHGAKTGGTYRLSAGFTGIIVKAGIVVPVRSTKSGRGGCLGRSAFIRYVIRFAVGWRTQRSRWRSEKR